MLRVLLATLHGVVSLVRNRADVACELTALRHQLAVLHHHQRGSRPRLCASDRLLWAWLLRLWPRWRAARLILQPDTVVRWHRAAFKIYWAWKSRRRGPGRPKVDPEI